jgi:hypothetical protein
MPHRQSQQMSGTLTRFTENGHFGIILLDEPHKGIKYAIIDNKTVVLHKPDDGTALKEGAKLIVKEAEERPETFRALCVEEQPK